MHSRTLRALKAAARTLAEVQSQGAICPLPIKTHGLKHRTTWWIVGWPSITKGHWINKYEKHHIHEMILTFRNLTQSYELLTLYDAEETPLLWKGVEPIDFAHAITVHALQKS